jgi:ABC-type branched-subunit amino acid transport system substrate-binding protein
MAVAVTAGVAACGGSSAGSGSGSGASGSTKKSDYLIGVTDDLSGPVSSYGQNVRKTWTAYVDAVNKKGGIDGRNIKLVFKDDQSKAAKVSSNIRSLISQDAILVTSSTLSSNCAIGAKIATQQKVPLSCWAANPDQINPVGKYVFERFVTEEALSRPMIKLASKKVTGSSKRMAIAAGTSEGAQLWAENTAKLAKSAGWTVVDRSSVDLSQGADVSSLASKVAAAKPDVVLFEITQPASDQFVRQLRTLGSKAIAISLFEDLPGMRKLKDPGYYQMFETSYVPPDPTTDAAKTYRKRLKSHGISGPNVNLINVGLNYEGIAQIVASLKKCGNSCTRESLADAMENTTVKIPGVTLPGGFGYSSESHIPIDRVQPYVYDKASGQPKAVGQALPLGKVNAK